VALAHGRLAAFEGLGEALVGEGLQEVVHRPDLERGERVLGVGGHEDHARRGLAAQRLRELEAGRAGHLHVEEDEVGLVAPERDGGLGAGAALGDDRDLRVAREQEPQGVARGRLVVGDERADGGGGHAASARRVVRKGRVTVTAVPPPRPASNWSEAAAP